ncbi:MAG: TOPRIM nucleotidyl transferase/hydrolase domain-containing protein [Sporichthyaceae bacterium]
MGVVVLFEGTSDRAALLALAGRRSLDLGAAGVEIVAMGGITNTYAHLRRHLPAGVRVAGLYDAPEERHVRSALERTGAPADGFFACYPDLEYELVRALGLDAVESVVAAEGELRSLELLTGMPAQSDWTRAEIVHRFLGVKSGRKARYARLLVEALDLRAVPAPLDAVLDWAWDQAATTAS